MDEKNEADKLEDVMMPGFRFHPTDEELVGFYLKKKIQQRTLPIELIKQVDIYKYDPWDLPKLASTGEKEWYFYCPRDRKYRNSNRPNRVTGSGFWKATGTDRPIYASEGTKCIGLKKSLVFYRGRAAKGIKTDWMMHEFRLPTLPDSAPPKKFLDKNLPPNDAWAICRIFKKTNSMAQRAFSHSWASQLPETTITSDIFTRGAHSTQYSPENNSCTTETRPVMQFCGNTDLHQISTANFFSLDIPSYKPINSNGELPNGYMFSPLEMSGPTTKCMVDIASMLFNQSPTSIRDVSKNSENIDFERQQHELNYFSTSSPQDIQGRIGTLEEDMSLGENQSADRLNNQWGSVRSFGFPFSLPSSQPNWPWDSPPSPSDISTTYSTNKCDT